MANNVPAQNALDLALIQYAYGQASSSNGTPPSLPNGIVQVGQPISEPGGNQTLQVYIFKNTDTGQIYVVPRGTNNVENGAQDLQIPNNAALNDVINATTNYLTANFPPGSAIEFVGHSLGGYEAVMIANNWMNFVGPDSVFTTTVNTYNSPGVPTDNLTLQMISNLTSITTNYRLMLPGDEPQLSNGMVAGDIVSTLFNQIGTVVQVAAAPGTFGSLLDLHSAGTFSTADWSTVKTIATGETQGLGIDSLAGDMSSITQVFNIEAGSVGTAGQVANLLSVFGITATDVGVQKILD